MARHRPWQDILVLPQDMGKIQLGDILPIFHFESKENRIKMELKNVVYEIAQEAARNFYFNQNENPVLKKFRGKWAFLF